MDRVNLADVEAVLFDLDGVLTPTAEVHMRAWSLMFNDFLATRGLAPYTDTDYHLYVDGKPRYDGVRDFLASRQIVLPEGAPTDAPDVLSVCGLGNRKNQMFNQVLATEGVQPFPGSVRYLDHLFAAGIKVAVVSSSRNAPAVLIAAGLAERFKVVVDGAVAAREELPGKPNPHTFWRAADLLGVAHGRCLVIEDAISGVQAGAAGGFAGVVGVDRGVGAAALTEAGADVVVADLAELIS